LVQFYTYNMKNMFTKDMLDIVEGTYQGEIQDEYHAGLEIPDYTLSSDARNALKLRTNLRTRNDREYGLCMIETKPDGKPQFFNLSQLFKVFPAGTTLAPHTLVWCACRYNDLKDVGGKKFGVNAAQGSLGNVMGQYYFNPSNAHRVPGTMLGSGWS